MARSQHARTDLKARLARLRLWVRHHVRPGWRAVVGVLLICGGLLGFLPVLGFWMIPLGIAVAALDLRPLWRRWRGRR
ncbi:hypothetical protein [Oceanicola sp. D3]|uniref:hypothetical protein n=1 Tax=Oceanicola sp. D3 TaxID=2587163 RepID=UPI0020C81242|nr:hypothetical protein [Oceanicola sp. D3]